VLAEFSIVEGAYLRDILDQPQALENTLASLQVSTALQSIASRLRDGRFRSVVLTGMGSSFHALHPANLALIDHGSVPMMVESGELVHYMKPLFDPETLIIAVSQSGQSAEIVRLLDVNQRRAAVVAVTNTAESQLVKCADAVVLTSAGSESSVSCKTYVTALMALEWLVTVLCNRDVRALREEMKRACPLAQAYLADWKSHVQRFAELLGGIENLFLVGRGPSLAAVGCGALIIKESDHFSAEGMSSAGFRHGPFEMLSQNTYVVVFGGDERTRDLNLHLLNDIRQQGGRAELIGEQASPPCKLPVSPKCFRPILEILPMQMITLALAAQAGREPGRFELASKITTRE
jgi:glutamine---fructose-6-phosphate transaminase (isomerizing)